MEALFELYAKAGIWMTEVDQLAPGHYGLYRTFLRCLDVSQPSIVLL